MHATPWARRWLHRMAERLAAGRHSHRPADPAAAQWQCLDAELRWRCAAEHRDDIKNAMEWVSYGIRRSMARSMFPQFPEGCQGKPFREIYQLNKKVRVCVVCVK